MLKNKPEDLARIIFTQHGQRFSFNEMVIDQDKATEIALGNKYTNIDFIAGRRLHSGAGHRHCTGSSILLLMLYLSAMPISKNHNMGIKPNCFLLNIN